MGLILGGLLIVILVTIGVHDSKSGGELMARFESLDQMFQVGAVLFLAPILMLLSWFMISTNRAINETQDSIDDLKRNHLSYISLELKEEEEEANRLKTFDLNRISGFDALSDLRSSFRYEPLRRRIVALVESFKDRRDLFRVGLEQFKTFQQDIQEDVSNLKKTLIELDHHSHVSKQYATLSAEIDA